MTLHSKLLLFKIHSQPSTSRQSLFITHTVSVQEDISWSVVINGHTVDDITSTLSLQELLSTLDDLQVCLGNQEVNFLKMGLNGSVKARVEDNMSIHMAEIGSGPHRVAYW